MPGGFTLGLMLLIDAFSIRHDALANCWRSPPAAHTTHTQASPWAL